MTKQQIKEVATLAMVKSLPDMVGDGTPNGRLRGLFDKVSKQAKSTITRGYVVTDSVYLTLDKKLQEWGDLVGWFGKTRHTATVACFLTGIVSDYDGWDDIADTLADIYEYFNRAGKAPAPSAWAGTLAYRKWEEVWDE